MPWWKADSAPKHGLFDQKTKKKKTFLTSTEEILSSQHVKPNILNGENLPILCCCDSAGALVMVGEWSILTSSNNRTPVLCWKIHSTIPALGDVGAAKWSCLRWSQTSPSEYQITCSYSSGFSSSKHKVTPCQQPADGEKEHPRKLKEHAWKRSYKYQANSIALRFLQSFFKSLQKRLKRSLIWSGPVEGMCVCVYVCVFIFK